MAKTRELKPQGPTIKSVTRKIRRLKLALGKTPSHQKQRFENLSRQLATQEQTLQELGVNERAKKMTSKNVLAQIEKVTAPGTKFSLPDGKEVLRPAKVVPTGHKNTFAAEEVKAYYPDEDSLAPYVEKGDYIFILKHARPNPQAVAVPVLFEDIQKARSQRFRLLELSKRPKKEVEKIQADLIRKAIEIKKGIKADKTVIKNYLSAWMDCRHPETIASDLLFITKLY